MLQIVFNYGDNYGTTMPTPFYNQTWFASLVSLSVAVGVALFNNHNQKKNKKKEKDKQHSDLAIYFFAQCEDLLSSVSDQLNQYSQLKKQIEDNAYGGYKLSIISSLNLDKIYALTPIQTFEIFVKESEEAAKNMSEEEVEKLRKAKSDSIIKIYRAFDTIQTVKNADAEVRAKFTADNTLETTNYWETIYNLKLFRGHVLLDRENKYFDLGEKLHLIVWEFDTVSTRTVPEAQELLVEKMREVFKSKENFRSPYFERFSALNADAIKYKSKCEAISQQLGYSVDSFIASLKRAESNIREEIAKLKEANENPYRKHDNEMKGAEIH